MGEYWGDGETCEVCEKEDAIAAEQSGKETEQSVKTSSTAEESVEELGSKPRKRWELRLLDAMMWFAGAVKAKKSVEATICLQLAVRK